VVIDECTAIVGVDPSKGKREFGVNLLDGIQHAEAALTHDRLVVYPAGDNVDTVQAMEEFPNR